ncbi:hypothetical protein BHM03_00042059 [Ensete ventricosum]|nr:hypothetical protein BHM03_00042059 [Ensete ventricosum]
MATASLFAALVRGSRPRSLRVSNLRASPIAFPGSPSRSFSSVLPKSDGLSVEEEPADPEDDLRSRVFRLRLPKRSATAALDRWVGEGRTVSASELRQIAKDLRRSQRYKHALEWMKTHREAELSDRDYAMRIDLITKVFGVNAAEDFFQGLPSSAKSCEACTALLHSYAAAKLTEKAEKLFERIKESSLSSKKPLDASTGGTKARRRKSEPEIYGVRPTDRAVRFVRSNSQIPSWFNRSG